MESFSAIKRSPVYSLKSHPFPQYKWQVFYESSAVKVTKEELTEAN